MGGVQNEAVASGAHAGYALTQLIALVAVTTMVTFNTQGVQEEYVRTAQFGVLAAMLVFFAVLWSRLAAPTAEAQGAVAQKRLEQALQMPGARTVGISREWYDRALSLVQIIAKGVALVGVGAVTAAVATSYPQSAVSTIGGWLADQWREIVAHNDKFDIFFWGILGAHLIPFWTLSLGFAAIDFARPSLLMPFKVQEDQHVTASRFVKACGLALFNQSILIPVIYGVFHLYEKLAPDAFSAELPSLPMMFVQMLACAPFAEFIFYAMHILLHTEFMFKHVHYLHHTWPTPVAVTAIYSHPVEFMLGNVPILTLGPLVLGIHVVPWIIFVVISTWDTCHGHSGWHFPLLSSNELHDFHHSTGPGAYGTAHIMDDFFGTSKQFLASWHAALDKTYSGAQGAEYPVDKVLNQPAVKAPCVYYKDAQQQDSKVASV